MVVAWLKENFGFSSSLYSFYCFDSLHTDVWGPTPLLSPHGCKYFIMLIDGYSRCI